MAFRGYTEDDYFVKRGRQQMNEDISHIDDDATAPELARVQERFYVGHIGVKLSVEKDNVEIVKNQSLAQVEAATELNDQRDVRQYGAVAKMADYYLSIMSLDGRIPIIPRKQLNIYKELLEES